MKKVLFLSFVLLITMLSCEKDIQTAKMSSKLWLVDNINNGVGLPSLSVIGVGDTMDFRDNGLVFITTPNNPRREYYWTTASDRGSSELEIAAIFFNQLKITGKSLSFRNQNGNDLYNLVAVD